jgi:16S rRNA (cytosine967-C5)-methyltransferase
MPAQALLEKSGVKQADSLVQGDHLRLWPHRHGTDGFFAAIWERQ